MLALSSPGMRGNTLQLLSTPLLTLPNTVVPSTVRNCGWLVLQAILFQKWWVAMTVAAEMIQQEAVVNACWCQILALSTLLGLQSSWRKISARHGPMVVKQAMPTLILPFPATTTSSTQQPTFVEMAQGTTPTSQDPSLRFAVTGTTEAPARSRAAIAPNYLQVLPSRSASRMVVTCSLHGVGNLVTLN